MVTIPLVILESVRYIILTSNRKILVEHWNIPLEVKVVELPFWVLFNIENYSYNKGF